MKVLALDPESDHFLESGLLASAGPSLQYLRLVMSDHGPGSQLWAADFWRAVKACPELIALHLVFQPDVTDPQVASQYGA